MKINLYCLPSVNLEYNLLLKDITVIFQDRNDNFPTAFSSGPISKKL